MKKALFLLLAWVASMHVYAQDPASVTEDKPYMQTQKKFTFAIQPMQLFNSSLRYDFEFHLGKGPGWLQLGPAFYYVPDNNQNNRYYEHYGNRFGFQWSESYSEAKGMGIDVNYKHFLDTRRSFYMAAGLSYARFNIKFLGQVWEDYIEDGLKYSTYKDGQHAQQIDRWGVNHFIGFQIPAQSAFLFDVFGGYAIRFSSSDENKPAFDSYMFSYGYTGFVLTMGIRIGFGVR